MPRHTENTYDICSRAFAIFSTYVELVDGTSLSTVQCVCMRTKLYFVSSPVTPRSLKQFAQIVFLVYC